METLDYPIHVLSSLCVAKRKPGMSLTADDHSVNMAEFQKAAPFISGGTAFSMACGNTVFVFFDTEPEMFTAFDSVVGDDGPTETNPYDGPASVMATACDASGRERGSNT